MNNYEQLEKWVREQAEFSSKPNTATFYAREFRTTIKEGEVFRRNWYGNDLPTKTDPAKATTIQRTEGGAQLERLADQAVEKGEITREQRRNLWAEASTKFAEKAEGKVRAFTENAKEQDIWIKKELPALLKNEKVTEINGHKREDLKAQYDSALKANKHLSSEKAQETSAMSINSKVSPAGRSLWDNERQKEKLHEVGYNRTREKSTNDDQRREKLLDRLEKTRESSGKAAAQNPDDRLKASSEQTKSGQARAQEQQQKAKAIDNRLNRATKDFGINKQSQESAQRSQQRAQEEATRRQQQSH